MEALACCCAVTNVNGSLIGDPLDVKMFQSTRWVLDEEPENLKTNLLSGFSVNNEAAED